MTKDMTNPNADPEIIYVATDKVACDGDIGPLGHPRIYIPIDPKTHRGECGYCDRVFIKDVKRAFKG